jgi:hypothetical protein
MKVARNSLVALLLISGLSPALSDPEDYATPVWAAPDPRGTTLTHLTAAGSFLIKTGKGWISTVNVNTSGNGTLTIYDGIDATGTVLAVIDTSKNTTTSAFSPWPFKTGLFMVQTGAADVTIISH